MIHKNSRILVLSDSVMFREIIRQAVRNDRSLEILQDNLIRESPEKIALETRPDVIVLSENPGMNWKLADLLDRLQPCAETNYAPCIVIGEGSPETERTVGIHDAEFIHLPPHRNPAALNAFSKEFCTIVKLAAAAAVSMRITSAKVTAAQPAAAASDAASSGKFKYNVIAIGASTGGTEATASILEKLPAAMPGIVITQHMPQDFTKMYAERLNRISKLSISEAKDGDRVLPGTALVAPGGMQMSLKKDSNGYYVHCAPGERVNGHCPSVGVLFDSAAKCAGKDAIGVILTGMGQDGAYELLHMREAGAFTIGQDRDSCVVYGMPMVAYNVGAVMQQLPLDRIAEALIRRISEK
jgi:two-component system chemotaxis response regulator CheB